jgi:SAM-dependent methyltransferase
MNEVRGRGGSDSSVADVFRCPACSAGLTPGEEARCTKCAAIYPLVRGIRRFVDSERYVRNFGFQWNKHRRTQFDTPETKRSESFLRGLGLRPELVAGRTVVDAGCGAGRYADVLQRWGGRVIAMDLSVAVEACHGSLGERGVTVVQADLARPPIAPGAVDVVVSLGVLHHTPDARESFRQLARLVKPGGLMAVWLYDAYGDQTTRMRLSLLYRRFTHRLPPRLLYALCHLSVPWHYLNRVPLLRHFTSRLWHISEDPWWRWRVLDTFDWYSPRYQSHHTYPEISEWFVESGFEHVTVSEPPVAAMGVKAG